MDIFRFLSVVSVVDDVGGIAWWYIWEGGNVAAT